MDVQNLISIDLYVSYVSLLAQVFQGSIPVLWHPKNKKQKQIIMMY